MDFVRAWFHEHFSNPQVVLLVVLLAVALLGVVFLAEMLAPLIAALVIAYVLDAPTENLRAHGLPRWIAVILVFLGFLSLIAIALLAILPLLSQQLSQLVGLLPGMATRVQELLLALPDRYPELVGREQVLDLTDQLRGEILVLGQNLLMLSVDRIGNLVGVIVYLFLVPFLVFFFLKDKGRIQAALLRALPEERTLVATVWSEVDRKTGAYVKGKVYEIGIVGAVAWLGFSLLSLDFAALLAALTGLSVLIPYIGVAVVSVPVALVALFQFGLGAEFAAAVGVYTVIQLLDGNLLAPLLISEIVDLHPVAVIGAILLFGGIWGFWGVFFAVPLATVAIAIRNAWPETEEIPPQAAPG